MTVTSLLALPIIAMSASNIGRAAEDVHGPARGYLRQAEDFRLLAERGDPVAQTQLGRLYERGLGVPQSFRRAINLYRQAARNGYEPARRRLQSLGVSMFPPAPEPKTRAQTADSVAAPERPVRITVNTVGTEKPRSDLHSHDIILLGRPIHDNGKPTRRPRLSPRAMSAFPHGSQRIARGPVSSVKKSRPRRLW